MRVSSSESELQPSDVIELDDITQLPVFEDMVALDIQPNMTPHQFDIWKGRVALRELIRPPKFNGTIADIRLIVTTSPYERLLEVDEEGARFVQSNGPGKRLHYSLDSALETSKAFTFTANAKSSGIGTVGIIQTELFYLPTAYGNMNSFGPIKRYVTKPLIDNDSFIALDERSKRIGFETLRANMMHSFIAPHR